LLERDPRAQVGADVVRQGRSSPADAFFEAWIDTFVVVIELTLKPTRSSV
jgi:hypothetical protein